jgi:hypothetical protein
MNGGGPPVIVMNTNMERQTGHKAQLSNIQAAKVCIQHSFLQDFNPLF